MTGKSPAQAGYEAYAAAIGMPTEPWEALDPVAQNALDACAEAVIKADDAERGDLALQLDYANRHCEDLQAVIADILGHFGPSGSGHTARVGQVQIAKWRTRAGLTTRSST